MKKSYITLLLLSIVISSKAIDFNTKEPVKKINAISLDDSGNGCFDENTHLLNIGIGFGGGNYYRGSKGGYYSYNVSPAFSLSYEQALKTKLGPGYLGFGGYLGYRHARYRYDYTYNNYWYNGNTYNNTTPYYYEHRWNNIFIAARGVYHWDELNWEKGEVYGGLLLGLRIQTYSYATNDSNPYRNNYQLYDNHVYAAASAFIGGRWFPTPKIALFAEVGYGVSILTAGASFKF